MLHPKGSSGLARSGRPFEIVYGGVDASRFRRSCGLLGSLAGRWSKNDVQAVPDVLSAFRLADGAFSWETVRWDAEAHVQRGDCTESRE